VEVEVQAATRGQWTVAPPRGPHGAWLGAGPGPGPGVGRGVERGRTGTMRRRCLGLVHGDVHMHRTGMRRSLQCTGTGQTRAGAVCVGMGTVDVGGGPGVGRLECLRGLICVGTWTVRPLLLDPAARCPSAPTAA
jgi:hypothetical protein